MKKFTWKATLILMFLYSFVSVAVLAKNPAKTEDSSGQVLKNNQTSSLSEDTRKVIEKLQKKMEKSEEKFKKEKTDLETKIAGAQNEDAKKKFQDKLVEAQAKFDEEKKRVVEQIDLLKKIPAEKQTRNVNNSIRAGICGDLSALTGDPRRVIDTNGPPVCQFFPSQRLTLNIMNASAALQSSGCWDPLLKAYTFEGPSMLIFSYFPVDGAAQVYVFVDMRPVANYSTLNDSEVERDSTLLDICPPLQPQRHHPELGGWQQLNFAANWGDSYDSIMQNLFRGAGGGGRFRGGFEAQSSTAKSQRIDPFALRSIVLDNKISQLLKDEGDAWIRVADTVWKNLGGLKEYSELRKLDERISDGLREDSSRKAFGVLAAELDKAENIDPAFKVYSEKLKEAAAAPDEKKARRLAKSLLKEIEKNEKTFAKKIGPIKEPLDSAEDHRSRFEFMAAGEAMSALIKVRAKTGQDEPLESYLDSYKIAAKSLQDYLENLKSKLVLELKQDEFLEAMKVKFGEKVYVHGCFKGSTYDFEVQRPKLKVILKERVKPINLKGEIDKNDEFIEERRFGLIKIDELIEKGFDRAVLQNNAGISVVHLVKGGGMAMTLLAFTYSDGVTAEEVSLVDLKDKRHILWLPFVIRDKKLSETMIPADPAKFLTTFNFTDRENHRLTVVLLPFDTAKAMSLKKADGSAVTINYFLYPGLYEERIKVVDSLELNPKKRELQLPPIFFRVLLPEQR